MKHPICICGWLAMKGVWLENGIFSLRSDLPVPEPKQDEVLVKVKLAGICRTDIELSKGYYPYVGVVGHEFVGVVPDQPTAPEHLRGKTVVGEINCVCNSCYFCSRDIKTHCESRTVLGIVNRNGAMAQYLTLPAQNLHIVPDSVPANIACFAEPLAAALQIQEQITLSDSDRVLVIGAGKLGMLIAISLALTRCQLTVLSTNHTSAAMLNERNIKTSTSNEEIKPGSFDVVVECSGNPEAFETAIKALRCRGTLVMKSTYAGNMSINAEPIVVNELTLIGSRCGPMDKAMRMIQENDLQLEKLVSAQYPLDKAVDAIEQAKQKGVFKVQLVMPD